MNTDQTLDEHWYKISRYRGNPKAPDDLLKLLKHSHPTVRWNAARELYFLKDTRAVESLIEVMQTDPVNFVRSMASQALGALHNAGVNIPIFADLKAVNQQSVDKLALTRLRELGVCVEERENGYFLWISHSLDSVSYLEVGYLMAQLDAIPFPYQYSPINESVPSQCLVNRADPSLKFRESDPSDMKFFIQRIDFPVDNSAE